MPIRRFNKETNAFEQVAGGNAAEIALSHENYTSKNVQGALSEVHDALVKLRRNINYLYHEGTKNNGGGGSSLPSVPNADNIKTSSDGRQTLNIVDKIEGDTLTAEDINAIIEVINNNAEMFFKIGTIDVPTASGGTETVTLSTAEDILNFIRTYGTSVPSNNLKPQLVVDSKTMVFTQRSAIQVPFTISDSDGGKFMVSFSMTDSSGATALYKFYNDDSFSDGSALLHAGDNKITIPSSIINSATQGTYTLSDFKVYDAYYKSSDPINLKVVVGTIAITEFSPTDCIPLNESANVPIRYQSVLRNVIIETAVTSTPLDGSPASTVPNSYTIDLGEKYSPTQINTFNIQVKPTVNMEYTVTVQIKDADTGGNIIKTSVYKRTFAALDENSIYVLPTLDKNIYTRNDIITASLKVLHTAKVNPNYDIAIKSDGNVDTQLLGIKTYDVDSISLSADTELDILSLYFTATYKGTDKVLTSITKAIQVNVASAEYGSVYTGTGALLWFDAKGRNNSESSDVRNIWPNKLKNANQSQYRMNLVGLRTSLNGWETPTSGLEYTGNDLKLSAGAYGVLENLTPFKDFSLSKGLTFEVCMHSTPASSIDTTLLSLGEVTKEAGIVKKNGIFVTPTEIQVYLGSQKLVQPNSTDSITYLKNGNVNSNEEEFLHITIVYKMDGELYEGRGLCLIYINGIISNAIVMPAVSSMDNLGQLILNGYKDYDGVIKGSGAAKYRFVRLYNTALSRENVLQNYIASMYNTEERSYVIDANRKWAVGDVPYISKMYMEGDSSSMTKSIATRLKWTFTKGRESELYSKSSSVVAEFIPDVIAADGVGKFEGVYANTKWQGSSSLDYMIKNYTTDILPLTDGVNPIKYIMTDEFPADDTFQMKANYIDSSSANNIACAKIANQIWARNWSKESLKTIQKYSDPTLTTVVYSNPMFLVADDNGVTVNQKYPIYARFHALNGFPYVLYRDFVNKNAANALVSNKFGGIYMCNIQHDANMYGFDAYKNSTDGVISAGAWARNMYYQHDNNGTSTFASELTAYVGQFDPRAIYNYSRNGKTREQIISRTFNGATYSLEECLGLELLMCYFQEGSDFMGLGLRNGKDHTQWNYASLAASGEFGASLLPFTNNDSWKYKWTWNSKYMYTVGTGQEPIRKINSADIYTFNSIAVGNIENFLDDTGSTKKLKWNEYAGLAFHQNLEYINACLWAATCSDADFADPAIFNRYFRLDSCIDYIVMSNTLQMSDSLGRNMIMVEYDKQEPVRLNGALVGYKSADKQIFYPHMYDMDTSFGTDVYGTTSSPYLPFPHAIGSFEGLETRDQSTYWITANKEMLEPSDNSVDLFAYQSSTAKGAAITQIIDPIIKYAYFNNGVQIGGVAESLVIPESATSVKCLLYILVGAVNTIVSNLEIPVHVTQTNNITVTNEKISRSEYNKPHFSWIVNNDSKIMKLQSPEISVKSYIDGVINEVVSYEIDVNGTYVPLTNMATKVDAYYPFTVCKSGQKVVFAANRLDQFNLYCTGDTVKIKAITASGEVIETLVDMDVVNSSEFSYNCVSNNLWRRICKLYQPAIKSRYSELRKGYVEASGATQLPILTISNIIDKYCTQIVNRVGEQYFNDDAFLKYFGSEFDTDSDIATKRAFVSNARGNKFLYVKDFLNKRLTYVDSIMGYVDETSASKGSVAIRHGFTGLMKIQLASVSPAYITLQWAQGVTEPLYLPGNEEIVEVTYDYTGTTSSGNTWMKLMNCPTLSYIGGLSGKKLEKIEVNGLAALKSLDISVNSFVQENPVSFINCGNLECLYMSKITGQGVGVPLDISGFEQLKVIDVSDSVIAVSTFSNNKLLQDINLAGNIFTTSLDLSGNNALAKLSITPENLVSIDFSDTSINFATIKIPTNSTWKILSSLNLSNTKTTAVNPTGNVNFLPALKTLNITGCIGIKELNLNGSPVTSLISNEANITSLNISNSTASIDFRAGKWISLTTIECVNNSGQIFIGTAEENTINFLPALATLNVTGCTALLDLNVSGLSALTGLLYSTEIIEGLDISNTGLILVELSETVRYSKLKRLTIVNNPVISSLIFTEGSFGKLEKVDVSDCNHLTIVQDLFKNKLNIPVLNDDFLARCVSLLNVDNVFEGSGVVSVPAQMLSGSTNVKTMIGCFKNCKNLRTIPSGVIDNMPNLINITDIFSGANLQYYTDVIEVDEIGDSHIVGKDIHNVFQGNDIFSVCPKLAYVTNAFFGSEMVNVPLNLFAGSPAIVKSDSCFAGIVNAGSEYGSVRLPILFPSTLWISVGNMTSAQDLFNGTYIKTIHSGFFSDCPKLTNASGLLSNTALTAIPSQIFSVAGSNKLITDLSYAFASSGFTTMPTNFLNNLPALNNVSNMFLGASVFQLTSGFLAINKITKFKFADLGLINLTTVNADIFSGNIVLSDVSGLFSGTKVRTLPDNLLSNNGSISNISGLLNDSIVSFIGKNFLLTNRVSTTANMFANRTDNIAIGSGFMQNSLELLNTDNMFAGSTAITSIPVGMMNNCPKLISVVGMFYGATNLVTIGTGFMQNVPNMALFDDMFKNTSFTVIPDNVLVNTGITTFKFADMFAHEAMVSITFLSGSQLSNIDGLYSGSLIKVVPDNSFNGHTIVNPIGIFDNSLIEVIGNNCFDGVKIFSSNGMFGAASTPNIKSIGNNFMYNSEVSVMTNMFDGCSIESIGDYFLGTKNRVIAADNACLGCRKLSYIGAGFLDNSSILANVSNIFKGCALLSSMPDGFLNKSVLVGSLIGVFSDNGITEIPSNFCPGNTGISSLTGVFSGSSISHIGDSFMINSTGVTNISSIFENNQTINAIGHSFMAGSAVISASKAFKNSSILSIGNGFLISTGIADCSYLLEGSAIQSIGLNFLTEKETLTDIKYIFNSTDLLALPADFLKGCVAVNSLEGVFTNNEITEIPDDFCLGNIPITSLTGVFVNSNITTIGNNFFKNSEGLISIASVFEENLKIDSIGNNFMVGSKVENASKLFKGSSIKSIGLDFLKLSTLTDCSYMFEGSSIEEFKEAFLDSQKNLTNIVYIFNNTSLSELPKDFLRNCLKVSSLEGVLTNNQITSVPDEFLMNNIGIASLLYLKDGVPTSVFADTLVSEIGNAFMYGSTGLTNIDNAFEGNATICIIGQLFLAKSKVTTANSAFKNVTNLETVGSGVLMGCPVTSLISMFDGCSSLVKIGEYTEWYDSDKNYLYQKETDGCKCNTAGQQAEVALFTSVPYLESEFDTLTCESITDLTKLSNVFKGTGLVRTPKGFLKGVVGQSAPVLSGVLNGSLIKFFNSDFLSNSIITDLSDMFTGTAIIAIPTGFMSKCADKTTVTVVWRYYINNIAYLPENFLRSCYLDYNSRRMMLQSNVRGIKNEWLSWKYCANLDLTMTLGGCKITGLPRNFARKAKTFALNRDFIMVIDGFWIPPVDLDTVIPEGFIQDCNTTTTDVYTNVFTSKGVKGVVPKTFLSNVSSVLGNGLRTLFDGQSIIGVEEGWLSQTISFPINNINISGMFSDCSELIYVADSMFSNCNLVGTGTNIGYMFNKCVKLKKVPVGVCKIAKSVNLAYFLYECSLINNSDGSLDNFLLSNLVDNSYLTTAERMFQNTGLTRVPDGILVNCPKLGPVHSMFLGTKLTSVPSGMLAGCTALTYLTSMFQDIKTLLALPLNFIPDGTVNACECINVFSGCTDISGTIPSDFMKNVKASNCDYLFNNCTNLTGVIPSNFISASSGIIKEAMAVFYNTGITGFENNIWNIADFSKVTSFHSIFYASKITELPTCFYLCSFDSLTTIEKFAQNSSITIIQDNFMTSTPKLTYTGFAFDTCTNLISVGKNFINNAPLLTSTQYCFNGCTNLVSISTGFISNSPLLDNIQFMFQNDTSLTGVIPVDFLNNSTKLMQFRSLFFKTKITGIEPNNIFTRLTLGASAHFMQIFCGCTYFTGALPELWTLYPSNNDKYQCFNGCVNASNWASVPAIWRG